MVSSSSPIVEISSSATIGISPSSPTRGRTSGGIKNFLGNWGSTVGGSQLGGGLGSMLFGPWGMLLGSLFGQRLGRNIYSNYQTPEKATIRDTLQASLPEIPWWLRNLRS